MSSLEEINALAQLIVEKSAALMAPPAPYLARTDRFVQPLPNPLPSIGPAGSWFQDPHFGARIWRATDEHTSAGSSLRVPSNTSLADWNADGTVFLVMNGGGLAIFHTFDPSTGPARLSASISSQIEPSFSYVDPHLIYGVVGHKVRKWDILTGTWADVLDLDTLGLNLGADTYVGGLVTSDDDAYVTFFGGTGQDKHYYVRHSSGALLDTRPLGFKVHSAIIERAGPNVIVFPAVDPNTGRMPTGITQIQVWNTATRDVTQVNVAPGGHASIGYGDLINADIKPGTPWEPAQWVTRRLSDLTTVRNLIDPLLPSRTYPDGQGLADHQNYRHAKPGAMVPIISSIYRWGGYAGPWRAWDDEIVGIASDGTVYRFAHHFSKATTFWDQPIISVRPQADWATVTTNYGQSLNGRQDVLVVELK